MLTGTHIKIANYIYRMLKREYGICLNKKNLIYGSIKPDFMKNKVPHYIDKSIDYIYDEIETLINNSNLIGKKEFSRKLGMIMHYISDYFCRAHNTEYYRKNLVSHLKYEKRLAKVMKNIEDDIECERNFISLKEYIIGLNKEYLRQKSLQRDREYTIKAINCVCGYVAEKILKKSNIKVA